MGMEEDFVGFTDKVKRGTSPRRDKKNRDDVHGWLSHGPYILKPNPRDAIPFREVSILLYCC